MIPQSYSFGPRKLTTGVGYYSYVSNEYQWGTIAATGTVAEACRIFFSRYRVKVGVGLMGMREGDRSPSTLSIFQKKPNAVYATKCAEFRLFTKNGAQATVGIRDANYDPDLTRKFVDILLAHRNVSKVYFNDAQYLKHAKSRHTAAADYAIYAVFIN